MYINNIFIVYDKGQDWVVYLKSVENVITLGKLIGLLFLFCLPLLSILFLKTPKISRSPCNGNQFSSMVSCTMGLPIYIFCTLSSNYFLPGVV